MDGFLTWQNGYDNKRRFTIYYWKILQNRREQNVSGRKKVHRGIKIPTTHEVLSATIKKKN